MKFSVNFEICCFLQESAFYQKPNPIDISQIETQKQLAVERMCLRFRV